MQNTTHNFKFIFEFAEYQFERLISRGHDGLYVKISEVISTKNENRLIFFMRNETLDFLKALKFCSLFASDF